MPHDLLHTFHFRHHGQRNAARFGRCIVHVEVPERFAYLCQVVFFATVGEEPRHRPLIGESLCHDFAGRGNYVVRAFAQVVQRLYIGHKAGIEKQVVGSVILGLDRRREIRNVDRPPRVAERTG